MIKNFACKDTEKLFNKEKVRRFSGFERKALKKLRILDSATSLDDLKNPPGNNLEKLKGDRKGQYSIRINDKWRVCFMWDSEPFNVSIVDYH